MNSRLVIADAAETRLCAWLSVSTFAGLLAYAVLGWTWLDAVAVIAGFAVMEGKEAWEGELVEDEDGDDEAVMMTPTDDGGGDRIARPGARPSAAIRWAWARTGHGAQYRAGWWGRGRAG
jgi:hypothetical protein